MLAPKKTKFRKWQTGRRQGDRRVKPETRGITVAFGAYGLKATSQARITANQIEAARRAMVRKAGKLAKVWIRVFPDRPVTKKPSEVRMGSGKGDLDHYASEIRPGRILFELDNLPEAVAREALRKAGTKLPMKVKVVTRV